MFYVDRTHKQNYNLCKIISNGEIVKVYETRLTEKRNDVNDDSKQNGANRSREACGPAFSLLCLVQVLCLVTGVT